MDTRIPAFDKDHDALMPGFYRSGTEGDVIVYDVRVCRPNCGAFIPPPALHSVEHMLAAALRNGAYGKQIVYFGPMGCRTGFYLLMRAELAEATDALRNAAKTTLDYGEVPGADKKSCGNYLEHDLADAKIYISKILELLH